MSRSLLVFITLSTLVPATLSAQATATMRASATVVAPQTVAPQSAAARLAESVAEQMQGSEQVSLTAVDFGDAEEPGVLVSMDVVEQTDLATPVVEQAVGGRQVVQMTVAYLGN